MRLSPQQGVTRGGQRPPEKQAGERSKACRPPRTTSPRRSPTKHLPLQHNKYPPPREAEITLAEGDSVTIEKQAGERSKACRPPRTFRLGAARRSTYRYNTINIPAPRAKIPLAEGDSVPHEKQAGERSKACRPPRTTSTRRSPTKHLLILHFRT